MARLTLTQLTPLLLILCTPIGAYASDALAKKFACTGCHQAAVKLMGPGWREIAAKYAEGGATVEQLAVAIKNGSSGKWGPMAMPAQRHFQQSQWHLSPKTSHLNWD